MNLKSYSTEFLVPVSSREMSGRYPGISCLSLKIKHLQIELFRRLSSHCHGPDVVVTNTGNVWSPKSVSM